MRKMGMILIAGLALAGCAEQEKLDGIAACQNRVAGEVMSPGSLNWIETNASYGRDEISGQPTQLTVTITYDAANGFGVPIRHFKLCEFPMSNGHAVLSGPEWRGKIGQAADARLMETDAAIAQVLGNSAP